MGPAAAAAANEQYIDPEVDGSGPNSIRIRQ